MSAPKEIGMGSFRHFLIAACTLCCVAAYAQMRDEPKYQKSAEKTAEKLHKAIAAEIRTMGQHDWAGEYYCGDGLGANISLSIAPKSGFAFEWHGCLGLYDRNYGAVTSSNSRLRLSFTFKNERKGGEGIAEELVPVAWGKRKYLIPSDDMVGFCNEVNAGNEPRKDIYGRYFLRIGDEATTVTGSPDVPPEFRPYLLERPITARILRVVSTTARPSIADFDFTDTTVIVDAGKERGLLKGMEMYIIRPDSISTSLIIKRVENEMAEGVITQMDKNDPRPSVGWELSTRSRWMQ